MATMRPEERALRDMRANLSTAFLNSEELESPVQSALDVLDEILNGEVRVVTLRCKPKPPLTIVDKMDLSRGLAVARRLAAADDDDAIIALIALENIVEMRGFVDDIPRSDQR